MEARGFVGVGGLRSKARSKLSELVFNDFEAGDCAGDCCYFLRKKEVFFFYNNNPPDNPPWQKYIKTIWFWIIQMCVAWGIVVCSNPPSARLVRLRTDDNICGS